MARTTSTDLPLGTPAPDFNLPDTTRNRQVSLADFKDAPALLVAFLCNHCPYVKHIQRGLVELARDYQPRGVGIVAISSNNVQAYPQDSPERMAEEAKAAGYSFPYLYDESQSVARAYRAACTPDLYLFDRNLKLVYHGQMDDSRRDSGIPVTGRDLRAAIDATLEGRPIRGEQKPCIGCNIKWRPGNEPD